jgi:hypothetical protein
MTMADALKHAACCQTEKPWPAEIDYSGIESDRI